MDRRKEYVKRMTTKTRPQAELEEVYDSISKLLDTFSDSEADEKMAYSFFVSRVQAFYSKSELNNVKEFECIVVGVKVTDYGKRKVIEKALDMCALSKEDAIADGYINEAEVPLERSGYNKGKPIDVNNVDVKECVCVVRENKSEDDFMVATLSLPGAHARKEVPQFTHLVVNVQSYRKKKDNSLILKAVDGTQINVVEELSIEQAVDCVKTYFPKSVVPFSNVFTEKGEVTLEQHHEKNESDYNRLVAFQCSVLNHRVIDNGFSDVLEVIEVTTPRHIEEDHLDTEEYKRLTCWIPKTISFNFNETAMGLLVVGRTSKNQEGNLTVNVMGVCAPERFRRPKNIKVIDGDGVKETETWIVN